MKYNIKQTFDVTWITSNAMDIHSNFCALQKPFQWRLNKFKTIVYAKETEKLKDF